MVVSNGQRLFKLWEVTTSTLGKRREVVRITIYEPKLILYVGLSSNSRAMSVVYQHHPEILCSLFQH